MIKNTINVLKLKKTSYQDFLSISTYLTELRKKDKVSDTIIFLEHNPKIFTVGKLSNTQGHFLDDNFDDIEILQTNRGGQVTWHGPGQLMGYPIFSINQPFYKKSIKKFVNYLIDFICLTLKNDFELLCENKENGIWIKDTSIKIGFVGLNVSRWITSHGFSLNISNDLSDFQRIIPCGITDKNLKVSNLEIELKKNFDIDNDIIPIFIKNMEKFFEKDIHISSIDEINELYKKIEI